jgi:hypothetical protein
MIYYNPYRLFTNAEKNDILPRIDTLVDSQDKTYIWNKKVDRLDLVSQKFYGHPNGGFLILNTNATLGKSEEDFPDGAVIIIPFPYEQKLQYYIDGVEIFKNYYV